MTIITAVLGVVLFYLSGRILHLHTYVLLIAAVGLASLVMAARVGAANPRLAAIGYRASIMLPLALGAVVASKVIWLTALIIAFKGPTPSPRVEALTGAILVAAGLLSDAFRGLESLQPASLAARFTRRRYEKKFPKLHGHDRKKYRLAYEAIYLEQLSDSHGPIQGWGYTATQRRLALIKRGL